MTTSVPNVNFFIGYVDCLKGKSSKDDYVKQNFEARRFYSSSKDYDYVKYVNTGSKEKLDFVAYSGNHEKSHGIFDKRGILTPEQIKELRAKLRKTNSPIWHGVISFTEEFGNQFCDSYEKAYSMMTAEFPKFFKKAGLNTDNITWFAGLHENTDNKHIHFAFFENEAMRTRQRRNGSYFSDGFIPIKAINSTKVAIELRLLNIAKEIAEKRKTMTQELKNQMENGAFMRNINFLIEYLPTQGRMQYESENMQKFRPEIDFVIYSIIKTNKNLKITFDTFNNLLSKRDQEIIKAYTKINISYEDKLLQDKYIKDLYRRLGNIVLTFVKEVRANRDKLNYDTNNRLKQKRIDKAKRKFLINKCMQLNDVVNQEIVSSFEQYLARLDEANYKRLKEEGIIEWKSLRNVFCFLQFLFYVFHLAI